MSRALSLLSWISSALPTFGAKWSGSFWKQVATAIEKTVKDHFSDSLLPVRSEPPDPELHGFQPFPSVFKCGYSAGRLTADNWNIAERCAKCLVNVNR